MADGSDGLSHALRSHHQWRIIKDDICIVCANPRLAFNILNFNILKVKAHIRAPEHATHIDIVHMTADVEPRLGALVPGEQEAHEVAANLG